MGPTGGTQLKPSTHAIKHGTSPHWRIGIDLHVTHLKLENGLDICFARLKLNRRAHCKTNSADGAGQ